MLSDATEIHNEAQSLMPPVADLHSLVKFWTRALPWGSKFFQFHAVFGKIWQNRMLVPPGELVPPPRGNP